MRSLLRGCYWAGYTLLALLAALWLSWQLLAWNQFFYPAWYELLGIGQTIARYAPQNRYRADFQLTSRSERERLFAAIATAVADGGKGLARLRYHAPDGRVLGTLLRPPEIVHLQDVSRLLARARLVGWAAVGLFLLWTAVVLNRRRTLPSPGRLLGGLSALLVVALAIIMVAGPVRVFYTWHRWVFPPGHPWFFYYQDSLMTTLMKAPELFIAIGGCWLVLTWLLWVTGMLSVRWLSHHNKSRFL